MSGTEVVKGDGWLHAGNALIRSVLHMDPDTLSDEAWGFQVRMAEWVAGTQIYAYRLICHRSRHLSMCMAHLKPSPKRLSKAAATKIKNIQPATVIAIQFLQIYG